MSEKDRMRRFALKVHSGKLSSYNKNHPSYEEWLDDLDREISNRGTNSKWKALDKIDFKAIPDTSFTRDRTGAGSIEYFSADDPGIRYPNGYYVLHPMPGNDVILYNPNDNDELDIRLDALHIMPKDATYDALNSLYRDRARDSDVSYNALLRYAEDVLKYGLDGVDSYELYFNNEADGLLRNMFIEGTPEYIESKHYYPDKLLLREWNKDLLPYIDRILNYLETGERPKDILPEVTIIGKNKRFDEGGPKNTNREYKSANSWSTVNVGKALAPILEPISRTIMDSGETWALFSKDKKFTITNDDTSTAKSTYLMPRSAQRAVFLDRGYEPRPKDYGLVKKAVGNRNVPVYLRRPDDASREDVVPIGNLEAWGSLDDLYDGWYGKHEAVLEVPAAYPTAFYISTDGKKIYQKGWDLNDYGDSANDWYDSNLKKNAAKALDLIGSPTVVTTGISEVGNFSDFYNQEPGLIEEMLQSKGLLPLQIGYDKNKAKDNPYYSGEYIPALPNVTIKGKGRNKKEDGGDITYVDTVRMDSNGNIADDKGNIIGDSVILPEVSVRPTTPQTNNSSYYQQWLIRQADRGGKNMSSSNREAYDKMMSRVASQNEVKNFTGFDGTIYNHGSGALELVSPEFDILTLGRQLYTDGLVNATSKGISKKVSKGTSEQLPLTQWTPEQWTAAQDKAIARGDMAEAQRLRDLHFQVSAPNSVTHDVFHHGNTKPMDWYIFDPKRVGITDEGYSGAGYYFAPTKPASQYVKEHLPHTLGPHGEQNAGLSGGKYHRYVYLNGETKYKPLRDHDWTTHTDFPFVDNKPIEVVVGDNRQIKLADAVTYDDNGVRIPLGLRDNFKNKDIRYGLIPLSIGGTALSNQYADGGPKVTLVDSDKIRMSPSGTFSDGNGNIIGDSVILPELTIRARDNKKHVGEYKSVFNPAGAAEFAGTVLNSPLMLADRGVNVVGINGTPVQTTAQRVGETLSPTRWIGTAKSGFKESPWSENNPGLWGDKNLDMMTDVLTGIGGAKVIKGVINERPIVTGHMPYESVSRSGPSSPVRSAPIMDLFRLQKTTTKTGDLGRGHYYRVIGGKKGLQDAIENGFRGKDRAYQKEGHTYWAEDEPLREYTKSGPLMVSYDKNGKYQFGTGNFGNPISGTGDIKFTDPNVRLYGRYPFSSKYHELPKTAEGIEYANKMSNMHTYIEKPIKAGIKGFLGYKAYKALTDNTDSESRHAEGGSIHIAPSKRDTFTAAATKYGMGVQEFASKVLANKDNYSSAMVKKANFAKNASKWKHGLGGYLFELGGPEVTLVDRDKLRLNNSGNFVNDEGNTIGDSIILPEIEVQGLRSDAYTVPNDNLWVNSGRVKNPELAYRGEYGAKSHALWEKEHPALTKWSYATAAAPFAVAAAPLVTAAGDALAATSLGSAVTSGLGTMGSYITAPTLLGAPAYAWGDAALTSAFGAHGIHDMSENGVTPENLLEVAPLGQLVPNLGMELANAKKLTSRGFNAVRKQLNAEDRIRNLEYLERLRKENFNSYYIYGVASEDQIKKYPFASKYLEEIHKLDKERDRIEGVINRNFDIIRRREIPDSHLSKTDKGNMRTLEKQGYIDQNDAANTIVGDEVINKLIPLGKDNLLRYINKNSEIRPLNKLGINSENITLDSNRLLFNKRSANPFNPKDAVTTGDIKIVDASTGKSKMYKLDSSQFSSTKGYTYAYPSTTPIKETEASAIYPQAPKEYIDAVQKNIDYVTNEAIPGSKVFGSSANVAKGNLYHDASDIDLLMPESVALKHPEFKNWSKESPDTYAYYHPTAGKLDVNILKNNGEGKAIGARAHELYAQLYPKEYRELMDYYIAEGKVPSVDLPLNKSAEELFESYDPVVKSIADAFGSSKDKHMRRAVYLLHYGKTDDVKKGFNMYANYILGGEYKPSNIPLSAFKDPAKNSEIIDALGLKAVNKEQFVNDPERMKLLYEYQYFHEGFLGRGVDIYDAKNTYPSLTLWLPEGKGGTGMGVGLNAVLGGDSGYGNIYGTLIPEKLGIEFTTKDPVELLKTKRALLGRRPLSEAEINRIDEIAKNHGIDDVKDVSSFAETLNHTVGKRGQKYKDFLKDIEEEFGIPAIQGKYDFLGSPYVSLTEDILGKDVKQIIPRGLDRPTNSIVRDRTASNKEDRNNIESIFNYIRNTPFRRQSRLLTDKWDIGSHANLHDMLYKRKRNIADNSINMKEELRSKAFSQATSAEERLRKLRNKKYAIEERKEKIKFGGKLMSVAAGGALLYYLYSKLKESDKALHKRFMNYSENKNKLE